MQNQKRENFFNSESGGPSAYVVDLKEKIRQEEEVAVDFFERGKDFFSGKLKELCRPRTSLPEAGIVNQARERRDEEAKKSAFGGFSETLRGLFSSLKLRLFFFARIWKLFFRFCAYIGWLAVFFARFNYLLLLKIISPAFFIAGLFARIKNFKFNFDFKLNLKSAKKKKKKEKKEKIGFFNFRLSHPILYFILALLIVISPFKILDFYKSLNLDLVRGKILGASGEAIGSFINASRSAGEFDLAGAQANFNSASDNFLKVKSELDEINDFLFLIASVAPDKNIRLAADAKAIVEAGRLASDLGNNLTSAIESLAQANKDKSIGAVLDGFIASGRAAAADADSLNNELKNINIKNFPPEQREAFFAALEKGSMIENSLAEIASLAESIKEIIGATSDKRYLLVFQNNSEMRASGGFIGSYALVDLRDGKIKNLEVPGGGSYDTEAGLKEKIIAPEPLRLLNPLWHFWDANWWPDWPTSARKLMWFFEKSDGPTVDGVISLTPTVMEKFLEIIGPVDMTEDYGIVIDSENFWQETQSLAEQKPDVTKSPKKIIGDLMEKIIAEAPQRLNQEKIIALAKALEESLDEKQILFYFNDNELEKKVIQYGWGGVVRDSASDYLMVVNTNIGGGKSDKEIEESISHSAEIQEDGSVINTVMVRRTHTGEKGAEFTGVRNVDWMRAYVPLGSELISAGGFSAPDQNLFEAPEPEWKPDAGYKNETNARIHAESGTKVYEENNHTVFANWTMIDPGETGVVYFQYRLPFILSKKEEGGAFAEIKRFFGFDKREFYPYSLLLQKQAGASPSLFKSSLKISENFKPAWSYPENLGALNGWNISDSLNKDKYWAVLLEKINK